MNGEHLEGFVTFNFQTKMEAFIKEKLDLKVLKSVETTSGCVSKGVVYETDKGKLFVKNNCESEAAVMFRGEYESLKEITRTKLIKVPEPLLVDRVGKVNFIVMEYLNMYGLSKHSSKLGKSLAELHLNNIKALESEKNSENFVGSKKLAIDKFGFHVTTACGYLPLDNNWSNDWVTFYTRQRLEQQVSRIIKEYGNREIIELWSGLQLKIPSFFKDLEIKPSLLHGDLWFGNVGETQHEPVIFDPGSFYGHHEFDLAIATMFGSFSRAFYNSYHDLINKGNGFQNRQKLYILFHNLNHWNHFGSHQSSSLQIMRDILR